METLQKQNKPKTQRFFSRKSLKQTQANYNIQLQTTVVDNKSLEIDSMIMQTSPSNLQIPESVPTKRTQQFIPLSATITFNMVREIIYFQRWNNMYPGDFLKNILPFFCSIVHEDSLDHQQFLYFLLKSAQRKKKYQEIKDTKIENDSAILLQESFQPSKIITCLKVNRQMVEVLDNVLNRVASKQIQAGNYGVNSKFTKLFRTLSIQQKFWVLCEARRVIISYNQFLFKKGTKVNSVFVTVKGEFSEIQSNSVKRNFSQCQFFGFDQILSQEPFWQKSVMSHVNGAIAFQISQELLFKYFNIKILSQKKFPSLNIPIFQRLSLNLRKKKQSDNGVASLDLLRKYCIHQNKFKILLKGNKEKVKCQSTHNQLENKKSMKNISLKYKQFQKLNGSNDAIKEVFKDSYFIQNMKRYSLSKEKQADNRKIQRKHFLAKQAASCLRRSTDYDSIIMKQKPKLKAKGSNKQKYSFSKDNIRNSQAVKNDNYRNPRDSSQIILKRLIKMQKNSKIPSSLIKKGKYYIRA